MMTISESSYSSNQRSSMAMVNDKVVHRDSYNDVQQSSSTNSELLTKRGFKPSDMFDPQKKEFLTNLSYKLFPNDHPKSADPSPSKFLEHEDDRHEETAPTEDFPEHRSPITVGDKEIDLNKIFTPAPDADEYLIKKDKTAFASSAFYDPGFHPTVKEQMELAKKISTSLSEPANKMSKGQSMYVNRKQRSVKWVHEGKGRNISTQCATPTPQPVHDSPYCPPLSQSRQQQQQQPKYNTLPRTFPKPAPTLMRPAPSGTSTLPRIEPFPQSQLSPLPDLYIPVQSMLAQTKLNDVYASPASSGLSSKFGHLWGGRNYNTAARGWGAEASSQQQQQQGCYYYRPVTFDDAGRCNAVPCTDF